MSKPPVLEIASESGAALLERWKELGDIAGFSSMLGFRVAEIGEGYARLTCPIGEGHANLMGGVHGGVMAGLVDAVTGCALLTGLSETERFATTDINIRYLKAAPAGLKSLQAEARLVQKGRRMAVAESKIFSGDDAVHAIGSAAMMIVPVRA